jgi:hypothetical protein
MKELIGLYDKLFKFEKTFIKNPPKSWLKSDTDDRSAFLRRFYFFYLYEASIASTSLEILLS